MLQAFLGKKYQFKMSKVAQEYTLLKILGSVGSDNLSAYDSIALEASAVINNKPSTLLSLNGHNSNSSAQYVQIFDSPVLPDEGSIPNFVMVVKSADNFSWDAGFFGKKFTKGIFVCNSSTIGTKTIGSADCWFSATFK